MTTAAKGEAAFMAKDYTTARLIWEKLVADGEGDGDVEAWLGALYANGLGVERNSARAFGHYLKSAESGNVLAANNVAVMYAQGEGTAVDPKQALAWFRASAEAGDLVGQFNYAVALTKGIGQDRDLPQAVRWYRKAAERGHYPSQARLGFCLAKGLGAEIDRVAAFRWLLAATQHGVSQAETALQEVLHEMSDEERAAVGHHPSKGVSEALRA
jgi:TPR repeat protein